ncbi:hypothetical protein ACF1A5_14380 [Streptomyces sp. NPDC014864]|uniref:Rv1733c family protein n=1 Tax=Streptomyces sp. NPDC014864 TaxID=3364924 RepID=UPI0036FCC70B
MRREEPDGRGHTRGPDGLGRGHAGACGPVGGGRAGSRTRLRGRRRRHSPLRRRSDVVEAWTTLAVAVLLFLGAPLAGVAAAWWAHDAARAVAAVERADRHRVPAEVVGRVPGSPTPARSGGEHTARAKVRWGGPGREARTAVARVPAAARHGDRLDVWLDSRGRAVPPPPDGTTVWQNTLTVGAAATGGTAALVLLVHSAVRRVALRRRLAEWEREWARLGPEWTRRRA